MRKLYHSSCREGKEVDPVIAQAYYDKGWVDNVEQLPPEPAKCEDDKCKWVIKDIEEAAKPKPAAKPKIKRVKKNG